MRIIGGELKGRKLLSVRGTHTRPTADRTREAIFNILGSHVREAVVLDLFAGTGALGLEALSRGAHSAFFIENNKRTCIIMVLPTYAFIKNTMMKTYPLFTFRYPIYTCPLITHWFRGTRWYIIFCII